MAYDFATRLDYLGERMQTVQLNTLVYVDPVSRTRIRIDNFTLEKIDVSELTAYGLTFITEKAQDFVFDTIKLSELDGVRFIPPPALPQIGHLIGFNRTIYEVFSIGKESYRYITTSRKRIRVHAKQIFPESSGYILDEDLLPVLDEDGKMIPEE